MIKKMTKKEKKQEIPRDRYNYFVIEIRRLVEKLKK
jgi:hypothetical protein